MLVDFRENLTIRRPITWCIVSFPHIIKLKKNSHQRIQSILEFKISHPCTRLESSSKRTPPKKFHHFYEKSKKFEISEWFREDESAPPLSNYRGNGKLSGNRCIISGEGGEGVVDGDKDRSRVSVSGIKVPINGYTRDTACLKPRPPTTGTHRRPLGLRNDEPERVGSSVCSECARPKGTRFAPCIHRR